MIGQSFLKTKDVPFIYKPVMLISINFPEEVRTRLPNETLELLISISLRFYKYNFLQMSTSHSAPKYYRTILSNLDYSSFDLFCNRIKLTKKLCNWHNHRVSTLRCLQQNAYPKFVAVQSPDNFSRSNKAAQFSERRQSNKFDGVVQLNSNPKHHNFENTSNHKILDTNSLNRHEGVMLDDA
uniref:Uncharacterized protein n=2 Tax=Trichobilharzia regenti TaxID=157069 RepID=A0AA85JBF0_TRIRE|nr:unnamed protein product [Trichobilharzia regenti]